jgi:L-fuculose-phosphate aldolase
MELDFTIKKIGTVRSRLKSLDECPLQEKESMEVAILEIDEIYSPALEGLAEGDSILLFTWLHKANRDILNCHPRNNIGIPKTGVFNTRSPDRPNPLGIHHVQLLEINGTTLKIFPLEVLDGTPILDLKPKL